MLKLLPFFMMPVGLTGCGVLSAFSSPPPRFTQFGESALTSTGSFESPQWSRDGRYLAYLDTTHDPALVVYDTLDKVSWTAATNISTVHFSWTPDGHLTYLRYRPDLSGSPYPTIHDLHQVDLNGGDDQVIAANLSSAGDFAWFSDGIQLVILLTESESRTYYNDIYLLNTSTNAIKLLLEADEIGLQTLGSIVLALDEKSLLIYGINELRGAEAATAAQLILYDLETRTVHERIIPSELMRPRNRTYPWPGIGDSRNATWTGGYQWFLAQGITPDADSYCYNYSLYFFNLEHTENSFCITTVEGIIYDPVISSDLKQISYVTMVGPSNSFLM